jgi:hypothetical protein
MIFFDFLFYFHSNFIGSLEDHEESDEDEEEGGEYAEEPSNPNAYLNVTEQADEDEMDEANMGHSGPQSLTIIIKHQPSTLEDKPLYYELQGNMEMILKSDNTTNIVEKDDQNEPISAESVIEKDENSETKGDTNGSSDIPIEIDLDEETPIETTKKSMNNVQKVDENMTNNLKRKREDDMEMTNKKQKVEEQDDIIEID